MARDSNSGSSPSSDMFEFEVTDFGEARLALDDLPAGVGAKAPPTQAELEGQRRKPLPTDRALAGSTIDWLIALPPALRPRVASEVFPRAVNLLATVWMNAVERDAVLVSLLDDRRPGRRGFPLEVRRELEALSRFAQDVPLEPGSD